jgi:hypothetical protein
MPGIWLSCGSHKSTTKQEMFIEESLYHQHKDTFSVSQQVEKTEHEDIIETIEEVTTLYDTGKPIDPQTGRPPLLSETKKNTRKETNKKKEEKTNTQENQSSDDQTFSRSQENDKHDVQKHKDETTIPKQIGGLVWAISALAVIVIIGKIVNKKNNSKAA